MLSLGDNISGRVFDEMDRLFQARLARYTFGLSPAGLFESYISWVSHLAMCPGRLAEIAQFPAAHAKEFWEEAFKTTSGPCALDPRFRSESWCRWPWRLYAESFRHGEELFELMTRDIPGFSPAHQRIVNFSGRQIMDAVSPNNFILTNPDLMEKTVKSGGVNLLQGAVNAMEDLRRKFAGEQPVGMENFKLGENIAATKGRVVFQNDLIELIQYEPLTKDVYEEPILILPAWIMKYYILDLSPNNSLVRWLLEKGHTVFMVSWKNPGSDDRDKGMDDYVVQGALAAIEAVYSISEHSDIHLVGYCLGGTLAMITAALMAKEQDERLRSLTLFAAQGDFTEAGELMLFVTPSEIAYLKNMMWAQGVLDTKQMSGAFQLLRSNDLIWSRMVHEYLMGERAPLFDLMAWNADATRMPYKMHSEYLERLFLRNEFSQGRFTVTGQSVAPENITVPIFAVGTEKDHVAPWVSVYKVHLMSSGDVTFALTSGGHNAGIVSEPGRSGRHYRLATKRAGEAYRAPEIWFNETPATDGSWWVAWEDWLVKLSGLAKIPAPTQMGNSKFTSICDAPGTYVFQK